MYSSTPPGLTDATPPARVSSDPHTPVGVPDRHPVLVVMGVSGSGKSTVAALLAGQLGWDFVEGDDLHPAANVAKMASGSPLTDEDRWPWLDTVSSWIVGHTTADRPGIVTCSALKKKYREVLREQNVIFVHLVGSKELLGARMSARLDHYMPASLLDSQLDTLEPLDSDERGILIDAARPPAEEAARIVTMLGLRPAAGSSALGAATPGPSTAQLPVTTAVIHPVVEAVTRRIIERSAGTRARYLARIDAAAEQGPTRGRLGCANLAHGFAATGQQDKAALRAFVKPNIGIVSSYNDVLSAHQPFAAYPAILKDAVRKAGGIAQVAGGVPAMCDGITQGRDGMQLSLFSRDLIAMATGVALAHDLFDGALLLGVCDKIVPGLVIGALAFGHLPALLVPTGPMSSGIPNKEKSRIRELYAEGLADREQLLEAETASYHSAGTCTFYGTANSNQMLMEVMGLHLPGASFVSPDSPLREALTAAAARQVVALTELKDQYTPIGRVVDEKSIVNGVVALLATGGSTNHTLHLPAIAAAAGIQLTWQDFADLSEVVPLLVRIYPNGPADINHFHAAGGTAFLIGQLLDAGLAHPDVRTVAGAGLDAYRREPVLDGTALSYRPGPAVSLDTDVLRPASAPFAPNGGLRMLNGNLGSAVIKVAAVATEHHIIEAPAVVFDDQHVFLAAFEAGELDRDLVAVIRYQGPSANGMPELHKLTPALGILQDRGYQVALVTDGRMSGASGKIPAAIHLTPEAAAGGPIGRIRDGDILRLDATAGTLDVLIGDDVFAAREVTGVALDDASWSGTGRELFSVFRRHVGPADRGASVITNTHEGAL
ncbi:phosphogluconate dehydratase [Cryobacterium zhongshanensis]|uniref:phosphogluconate dehydratase n=1 Tax=Cryobacterium zhongshanensis TaxID=2928153 RepID=UPI0027DF2BB5|nr:phosphogluconate dehydratase [Cryobacterium zhongshanensis]